MLSQYRLFFFFFLFFYMSFLSFMNPLDTWVVWLQQKGQISSCEHLGWCELPNTERTAYMSRITTKPTIWHVRPAKTQISLGGWVFAIRMKEHWVLSYPLSAQRRLWSDWADAQADLSFRWAHMPFRWFCHEAAHIISIGFLTIDWQTRLVDGREVLTDRQMN